MLRSRMPILSMLRRSGGASPRARHRRLAAFPRHVSGATTVEFALLAAPYFVLLFGALQLFLLSLSQQVLETAAESAGRMVLTGKAQNLTQAQFQQAVCGYIPALLSCANLMIDVETAPSFASASTTQPTLTYNPNGSVSNPWQFNPGTPGSIVIVRLMYPWPVFNMLDFQLSEMPNDLNLLYATAVFKNEAFQ